MTTPDQPEHGVDARLTEAEQAAIDAIIQESGFIKAAKRLDVSLSVLMRVAGHLGLRRGSVLLLRQGLAGKLECR